MLLYRWIKYITEYFFVRVVVFFFNSLNREEGRIVGSWLGSAFGVFLTGRARIAKQNLKDAFPNKSAQEIGNIVAQCWKNLGQGLAEFLYMPRLARKDFLANMECEGFEHIKKTYLSGKGALVLTAHYGAWEAGAKFWPSMGIKFAVVARRVRNPYVNKLVTLIRETDGVRVILSRDAVRESIRWLKQGNVLGMLIDHRVREGGLNVPFLGKPALTSSLPAILALRYAIPVYPAFCVREGNKLKVKILPAINFSGFKDKREDIQAATLRMNQVAENWIKANPQEWLWIHNRWKLD